MQKEITVKELFESFCEKDTGVTDDYEFMHAPFELDGYVYAASFRSVIRCRSEFAGFHPESKKTRDLTNLFSSLNMEKTVDVEQVDWDSLMDSEELEYSGEDCVCGNCGGDGECNDSITYEGKYYPITYECPVCDGTGLETQRKGKPTGRKTFDASAGIMLNEAGLYCDVFYPLVQARHLTGAKVVLVKYVDNNIPLVFRVGHFEIALFPSFVIEEPLATIHV